MVKNACRNVDHASEGSGSLGTDHGRNSEFEKTSAFRVSSAVPFLLDVQPGCRN